MFTKLVPNRSARRTLMFVDRSKIENVSMPTYVLVGRRITVARSRCKRMYRIMTIGRVIKIVKLALTVEMIVKAILESMITLV